jgi:ribosome-binding protein aMBF1 (putative translation factor)
MKTKKTRKKKTSKKKSELSAVFSRVGSLIAEYRFKSGMTGEELAKKVGISTSIVHQFERGVKLPSLITMIKLAKELTIPGSKIV